jgi:phosphoribosylamine-glycine ligase
MATRKILVFSHFGVCGELCKRLLSEGNQVKYYIKDKPSRDISNGLIGKVSSYEPWVDWADLIIVDDACFGEMCEDLREQGKAVVGPCCYSDKMEMDRGFGQQEFKKAGMTVLPDWTFKSLDEAIKFVQKNPGRYVVKPDGVAQDEKCLTYVGKAEDGSDVISTLENYKKKWAAKIKSVQLQQFAKGVEVAIGAFFNGKEFILPAFVNFEYKKMMNGDVGPNCYSADTEVLTYGGWKFWPDVTPDDEICTLQDGEIAYAQPLALMDYDFDGSMVAWSSPTVDLLVTPNHNMYVQDDHSRKPFSFERASSIVSGNRNIMRGGGEWSGVDDCSQLPSFYRGSMSAWASLVGIYIADGYAKSRSIVFGNCPKHKQDVFIDIANRAGFKASMYGKDLYINSRELAVHFSMFGRAHQKCVPQYIKDGSRQTIKAFLYGYGSGDGTRSTPMVYTTVSTKLADDLQELVLKSGGYAAVKVRDRMDESHYIGDALVNGNYKEINITECRSRVKALLCPQFCKSVPYHGRVYCATVPSHIMYVRRNGKASWQGNSGEQGTLGFWTNHGEPRLYDETLAKMVPALRAADYHGYMDLNCIATEDAVYPLEATPRFGVPTIWLQMDGINSKLGDFFDAMAKGKKFNLDTESGFQLCVVVSVPPFPYEDPKAFAKYSADKSIEFSDPNIGGIYLADVKCENDEWKLAGNSGYAVICVGKGMTMEEAKEEAYKRVKTITLPDMSYRTDIGYKWHKDGDLLRSWGWL